MNPTFFSLADTLFGAALLFPPLFKAVLLALPVWLLVHRLLRSRLYSGALWHPLLCDLSLFILAVCGALWMLTHG